MPLYEFECEAGHRDERLLPVARRDELQQCDCGLAVQRVPSTFSHTFVWQAGQPYTGVYKLDHGRYATHDLTPPGKFARLVREGVCSDPFAEHAEAQRKGEIPSYGREVTL